MFRLKIAFLTIALTFAHWTMLAESADAGLLRDWLNRRRARIAQQNCATPIATTPVAANFAGLQPGQCARTCQQTCSRTVVNYVPCTSYRTTYERVPVTQYRPQTTSDPCTGCSVTCMRPCTTYTYRTRRVPYTTYRPVYRTESYRVPVTTITNDCNTCAAAPSTCDTCNTGFPVAAQQGSGSSFQGSVPSFQGSGSSFAAPSAGTITTDGNFSLQNGSLPPGTTITELPADNSPSLNPQNSNRSVIESLQNGSSTRAPFPKQDRSNWALTQSTTTNRDWNNVPVVAATASTSPVTKRFAYTAIKQVNYETEAEEPVVKTIRGKFAPIKKVSKQPAAPQQRMVNQGWETVEW